jgi:hypothetical protein
MSPERFCPTVNRIEVWRRIVMFVMALVASPYLSAKVTREPDDGSEDDRQLRTTSGQEAHPAKATTPSTTLSIPLSGTGVQAHPKPSAPKGPPSASAKATVKKGATTGSDTGARNKDSGAAHAP